MSIILKNRVRDNTATTGTGTITLNNTPPAGYQSFSVVGNLNETYYQIVNSTGSEWEIGRGTYTASGTTLSRDFVLSSSNSRNKVSFSSGTKDVILVYPAALHAPSIDPADKPNIVEGPDTTRQTHLLNSSFEEGYIGEEAFSQTGIVSTFSILQTGVLVNSEGQYRGGVLTPNGEIHFIPGIAARGQKMNSLTGAVSTYSLIYTTQAAAYAGGVLAPNGDIHFVPYAAIVGQKVSLSGVVSTYALIYSATTAKYVGGVLTPNGDIHFVPWLFATSPRIGQAVNTLTGIAYTYSLLDTAAASITSGIFAGGVLTPNGKIYFIPRSHSRGQILDIRSRTFSTYSLILGAVERGFLGGVLAPNGDIHFIPHQAVRGQKISSSGVVSTYSLVFTTAGAYAGGVLAPNGNIIFINQRAEAGQRVSTLSGNPFPSNFLMSPYLNKF